MSDKNKDVKDGLVNTNTPLPAENETLTALQAELAAVKAEQQAFELEERKYALIEAKHRVARLEQENATKLEQAKNRARQIISEIRNREALQAQCTHMKGGTVTTQDPSVVMNGHGSDSTDFALIRHALPAGNLMLLCQRCLKEWYGPNPLTGEAATPGFAEAKRWPTKNHPSGSSQFWPSNRMVAQ